MEELLNVVDLLAKLLLKGGTLLCPELYELVDRLVHGLACHVPLFVVEHLCLCACGHVGHAEKQREPVGGCGYARILCYLADLAVVVGNEGCVHGCSVYRCVFLYPDGKVDLASHHLLGDDLSNLHLLLAVDGRDAC